MSRLTFAQAKARIQHHLPDKGATSILDALNLGIQEVALHFPSKGRGTFTTLPTLSGGTVTATQDSTDIVGSGTAFAAGYQDGLFRASGDDAWFGVPTVTDTTNIAISSAWAQDSGASKTYELTQPFITLPAGVMRLERLWIAGAPVLEAQGDEKSEWWSEPYTGQPTHWSDASIGSSGERRIMLTPFPDIRYVVRYTYSEEPTLYTSSDASETNLPGFLNPLIVAAALWQAWDQEDSPERSRYWYQRFELLLRRARAERLSGHFYQAEEVGGSRGSLRNSLPIGG